jgi:hypothetical protein
MLSSLRLSRSLVEICTSATYRHPYLNTSVIEIATHTREEDLKGGHAAPLTLLEAC